ncbi:MAG: hypothetical protein QMC67_15865 [Candidatus Wallbacteria bacterium]
MISELALTQNSDDNLKSLKKYALDCGMSKFGSCAIDDSLKGTFHPALLENPAFTKMQNAVSMAFHLSDAVLEGIFKEPTPLYAMHYNRVNSFLDDTALKITSIIQNSGYNAMPIPASQIIDKSSQRGYLNHKLIGNAAGIGYIGRNNLLVSPEFGSRMRLVTVLTDAPIAATPKLEINCGSCRACITACPVGAIGESADDFTLPKCVEQISKYQKIMFVAKGVCGICVKACRGNQK